jgi:hypothetical protein
VALYMERRVRYGEGLWLAEWGGGEGERGQREALLGQEPWEGLQHVFNKLVPKVWHKTPPPPSNH